MVKKKEISPEEQFKKWHRLEYIFPRNEKHLALGCEFKSLKKETQKAYIEKYDIIISNETFRELIFHGIDCKLSDKQFFMVKYLLQNGGFDNLNFSQLNYKEKRREYYHKIILKNKKIIRQKKYKGQYSILKLVPHELRAKIREIKNRLNSYISSIKSNELFSSDRGEIKSTQDKIKRKIKKRMHDLSVDLPDFKQKFELFMRSVPLNYGMTDTNPNAVVRTSYRVKETRERVSKKRILK